MGVFLLQTIIQMHALPWDRLPLSSLTVKERHRRRRRQGGHCTVCVSRIALTKWPLISLPMNLAFCFAFLDRKGTVKVRTGSHTWVSEQCTECIAMSPETAACEDLLN